MPLSTAEPFIRLIDISKRFPGVVAVDDVNLDIYPGEVHVVAGENGAGKSTLMKLLSQVERPSHGTILLRGQHIQTINPQYAQSLGIAMVYQEFALAPHLTVAQNIALGREPGRLAACRRERSSGQVSRTVSTCVLPGTGGSDSMEHGRRQKTAGDRERAGCK